MPDQDRNLSGYILPVAATMVGVCMTVISIIKLVETGRKADMMVDEMLSLDSLVFLLSALFSYLAIRSTTRRAALEKLADVTFLIGMALIVVASFVLAYDIA